MTQEEQPHPLMTLVKAHETTAVNAMLTPGRFQGFRPMQDMRNPERLLMVFRKSYGTGPDGPILGDEYLVAQPTHVRDNEGVAFRAGSLIGIDFLGTPGEIAKVEGFLYRKLLEGDQKAQQLVTRHMAVFNTPQES